MYVLRREQTMWNQYRLNKPGLDGLLGSLERQIMASVWELGEATVSDVQDRIEADSAYETIKTVMARLVDKGMLTRELEKRAYVYRATISQQELETQISRQMISSLIAGFGSTAIAQFADVLKENPNRLEELNELLSNIAEG
jgi:predicted transcriptional regulator